MSCMDATRVQRHHQNDEDTRIQTHHLQIWYDHFLSPSLSVYWSLSLPPPPSRRVLVVYPIFNPPKLCFSMVYHPFPPKNQVGYPQLSQFSGAPAVFCQQFPPWTKAMPPCLHRDSPCGFFGASIPDFGHRGSNTSCGPTSRQREPHLGQVPARTFWGAGSGRLWIFTFDKFMVNFGYLSKNIIFGWLAHVSTVMVIY